MNNSILLRNPDRLAVETCQNVIRELILHSDKYKVSGAKFNTLVKAYYAVESLPAKKITGYIDISANTHLPGGGLDYSSFTIGEDYFEIYTGFVSYTGGECDDSVWEKIYSSKDTEHRKSFIRALECWAESFLLHLDDSPATSLLVLDRSELDGNEAVRAEVNPEPKTITPNYSYETAPRREYDEVPF
ncbi:MAG: hypothetical protein K8I03_06645 [Ignavibacteria bacterium]|nr:hypothetical protein [Ignavibacteria bacterium]